MDVSQFALVVMKNVREFVQPALDALTKRIDDREESIRADFEAKVAAMPAGKDGAPGARGEPGDKGEPGINGKDGAPAADSLDVIEIHRSLDAIRADSFDVDAFCAEIEAASGS